MTDTASRADWAVMAAKSVVGPAAQQAEALAASAGVAVTVKTAVYVDDGSRRWASVLAELLCTNPELANNNRQGLAELLAERMQLDSFTANRLSKPLSTEQLIRVAAILAEYGYDTSTLKTGLNIRDIVKGNVRYGSTKPTEITTRFYADHIELDGVSFQYRPRERKPMGKPENDFCVRIAGVDVPLMAVLRIRNIGLGEFRLADEKALANADSAQKQNRARLDREYVPPVQLGRLYDQLQRATRESDKARRADRNKYVDVWSYTGGRLTGT
ncbi:hypothetical protein [Paraburkholderia phenoliruptrix]|uniref:hypothetical protein n=1 Tax=Paraburkholderia phenoliruptrix TaxID=252970 RepID=UPI002869EC3F|nr:hypothetical protein [Paraburkholderia phenoliruptrix]WMY06765.1 hypothetical protein P3F88_10685 [Paraburkholderia phenoliruptrix]